MGGSHDLAIFLVCALAPLLIAFEEGGLDIVFRQEVGVGVCWAAALAFAFGWLPHARPRRWMRFALTCLGLLIAWTALALVWTSSVERTYAEVARLLLYGTFVFVVALGTTRRNWRAAAAGLSVALLTLPLAAVISRAVPDAFDTGSLGELDRLAFPLGYWNALAAWSAMAVAVGLSLSSHLRSAQLRAASLAPVPIAGFAVYLTFSRGGAAACGLAALAVLVLSRNRLTVAAHALVAGAVCAGLIAVARSSAGLTDATNETTSVSLVLAMLVAVVVCAGWAAETRRLRLDRTRLGRRTVSLLAAGALTAGGVAFVLAGGEAVSGAAAEFTSDEYPAQEGDPGARLTSLEGSRDEVWGSALNAFASAPFEGTGPGTFEFWWTRDVPGGESLREPHSLYLGQLAESGVVGTLALAGFLGALLVAGLAAQRRAESRSAIALTVGLVSAFVVYLVHAGIDWLWESTALTIVALSGIGIAAASTSRSRTHRDRRPPWRVRAAMATLAVIAGAVMVPGVVATERIRASLSALVIGQQAEGQRIADDAVRAEPWAASPYAARGFARIAAGRPEAALADAQEAIEREPENWRHRVLLAAVARLEGDDELEAEAMDAARRLNPALALDADAVLGEPTPGEP